MPGIKVDVNLIDLRFLYTHFKYLIHFCVFKNLPFSQQSFIFYFQGTYKRIRLWTTSRTHRVVVQENKIKVPLRGWIGTRGLIPLLEHLCPSYQCAITFALHTFPRQPLGSILEKAFLLDVRGNVLQ